MEPWTIATVKRDLPSVSIRIVKGKIVTGRVSGRLNQFATVSVPNTGTLHSNSIIFADGQFSWEAIAHSLNSGKPLNV